MKGLFAKIVLEIQKFYLFLENETCLACVAYESSSLGEDVLKISGILVFVVFVCVEFFIKEDVEEDV